MLLLAHKTNRRVKIRNIFFIAESIYWKRSIIQCLTLATVKPLFLEQGRSIKLTCLTKRSEDGAVKHVYGSLRRQSGGRAASLNNTQSSRLTTRVKAHRTELIQRPALYLWRSLGLPVSATQWINKLKAATTGTGSGGGKRCRLNFCRKRKIPVFA